MNKNNIELIIIWTIKVSNTVHIILIKIIEKNKNKNKRKKI